MRIRYNAPFTLTFALVCAAVLAADQYVWPQLIAQWFTVGPKGSFQAGNADSWLRLLSYVFGHADWNHLVGNLSFILLLGPVLEEKYQTPTVAVMALLTALVTGIVNVLFFSTALVGASGIVFLFILLVSFTNIRAGEIPLTFVAILALYLGKEVVNGFQSDNISQFAHIIGGVAGSLFGFVSLRFQDPRGSR